MPLRRYKRLRILSLWLIPLLTSCGDFENDYYPRVDSIKVSAGKDYVDVTIRGSVRNLGDFISDVEVIKVGHEIILIPITQRPPVSSAPAEDRFEETVRIGGLQRGRYAITIMGADETTGGRTVITKRVEVK